MKQHEAKTFMEKATSLSNAVKEVSLFLKRRQNEYVSNEADNEWVKQRL